MKNLFKIMTVICLLGSILSCKHDDTVPSFCPALTDNISWESYGSFNFNSEGRDSTARRIVSNCNWHVHNGHNGGTGDTLQVTNSDEDVVFVWAFNSFYGFLVKGNWQGATHHGAKLNMHTTEFHQRHPEFSVISETTSTYQSGNISVTATFNGGYLISLNVGHYYRG